eukprot:GFUD01043811.1.p1 GENE.GFUD01043811.1~~GFUD01043811.1.p1  ORF type:complete len:336 (+),score=64.40 GFUD01043811.1:448-1455(+)
MESEKFCLRWNDFESNISEGFRELRNEKDFFDVTLACDDSQLQAHKVILSACSPFFRNVLRRNPHQHPLLYLKGVKYTELQSVLNFMYLGEVNVAQEELNSFLSVAEDLKVKGLTQNTMAVGEEAIKPTHKTNTYKQNNRPKIPTSTLSTGPPKRARIDPPLAPPATIYHQESDIDEFVHVKSEPHETQSQSSYQPQPTHLTPEEDPHQGPGTVALDQSYSENDGYDYQYEDAYQDGSVVSAEPGGGFGGTTGLESLIQSKMSKNAEGEWQCNDCYKTSKVKTNIFEHIEAAHVESPGYECEICYKVYRTRNSFRKHKNVNHKAVNNLNNVPQNF